MALGGSRSWSRRRGTRENSGWKCFSPLLDLFSSSPLKICPLLWTQDWTSVDCTYWVWTFVGVLVLSLDVFQISNLSFNFLHLCVRFLGYNYTRLNINLLELVSMNFCWYFSSQLGCISILNLSFNFLHFCVFLVHNNVVYFNSRSNFMGY